MRGNETSRPAGTAVALGLTAALGLTVALAVAVAPARPVAAQDGDAAATPPSAEDIYLQLHRGLNAKMLCERISFSRAEHMDIARRIDARVGGDIGAGQRLSLTVQARSEMLRAKPGKGCSHPGMAEPRQMFEALMAQDDAAAVTGDTAQ